MHRRAFLGALSVGLTSAVVSKAANITHPTGAMTAYVAHPQHIVQACPMWCWAASAAMIFAAAGRPVNQLDIVQATYGGLVCQGANTFSITQALSKPWQDLNGQVFLPKITAGYDAFTGFLGITDAFIVNELANNRPILYCNQSHAMVLVSCDYLPTPGQPTILGAGVLDPFPSSPAFHPLSPNELRPVYNGGVMTYLASVSI